MSKRFTMACLTTLVLFAVCAVTLKRTPVKAQLADKTLTVGEYSEPDVPVKVVGLSVGNQQITSGVSFAAGDDWLKDLSIKVQNVSNQEIKFLDFALKVQVQTTEGPVAQIGNLFLGKNYFLSPSPTAAIPDVSFKPGEVTSVSFALPPNDYNRWVRQWANLSELSKPTIYPLMAVFADVNTGWYKGKYIARDPNTPTRWVIDKTKSSPHRIARRGGSDSQQFKMVKTAAPVACASPASNCTSCYYFEEMNAYQCTDIFCTPGYNCAYVKEDLIHSAYGDYCREYYTLMCMSAFGNCNCTQVLVLQTDPLKPCPS